MDIMNVVEIAAAILGTTGLAGVIIFGLSSWLGKVWAERILEKEKAQQNRQLEEFRTKCAQEIERYKSTLASEAESFKIKLKKSEFIFEKEFEALQAIGVFIGTFLPTVANGAGTTDLARQLASRIPHMVTLIRRYLDDHGAALPSAILTVLYNALALLERNSAAAQQGAPTPPVIQAAEQAWELIVGARNDLSKHVFGQISV